VPPPCTDKSGEGGLSCTLDLWCTCASCTFAESSVTVSHARGYKYRPIIVSVTAAWSVVSRAWWQPAGLPHIPSVVPDPKCLEVETAS